MNLLSIILIVIIIGCGGEYNNSELVWEQKTYSTRLVLDEVLNKKWIKNKGEEFIKKARSEAESTKISIRNARREGNSQLKEFLKEKEISEDEERLGEEEIQKLSDMFVAKIEEALAAKEKDLLDF